MQVGWPHVITQILNGATDVVDPTEQMSDSCMLPMMLRGLGMPYAAEHWLVTTRQWALIYPIICVLILLFYYFAVDYRQRMRQQPSGVLRRIAKRVYERHIAKRRVRFARLRPETAVRLLRLFLGHVTLQVRETRRRAAGDKAYRALRLLARYAELHDEQHRHHHRTHRAERLKERTATSTVELGEVALSPDVEESKATATVPEASVKQRNMELALKVLLERVNVPVVGGIP